MGMNIIDDDEYYDDDEPQPKRTRKPRQRQTVRPLNQSSGMETTTILLIIGIMGAILVASFFLTGTECPEIPACPTNNLSCPQCPSLVCEKDNITVTPVVECVWNNQTINQTLCEDEITKVFIFSSLNYSDNTTYYLNQSTNYKQTTELNITELAEDLGETIVIRVE